jgi:hypothetical protein
VACRSRLATAGPWPASASTVCLRGVTHCPPLGRCHAATAHSPLRVPPSAIDRRPAARRLRAMPTTLWITNLGRRGLVTLLAYKPPPGSFPCTRQWATRLPSLPLAPLWWACPSACSPARPSLWSPSQTSTRASTITYGLALPHTSPGTPPPWRRRGCLATGHHRVVPRPSLQHQSTPNESNRTPNSFVCLPGPHLAAGERATVVGVRLGRAEGTSVNLQILQGVCKKFLHSLSVLAVTCKFMIKS